MKTEAPNVIQALSSRACSFSASQAPRTCGASSGAPPIDGQQKPFCMLCIHCPKCADKSSGATCELCSACHACSMSGGGCRK